MSLPTKSLLVCTSWAVTILLARLAPHLLVSQSIWKTSTLLSSASLIAYFTWTVLLYPLVFTPLRRLPQPAGGSLVIGHFQRIYREPIGVPQREWTKTVPNDGLIYYRSLFNAPRVIPTSAQALREVLSEKSYEFVKPDQLSRGLGQILGNGILLSEGDEHRIQRKNLMPAFSYRHVKELYAVFWSKTRDMILAVDGEVAEKSKETEVSSRAIEAGNWLNRATLDIIGVATMGKSFNALEDEHGLLCQTYAKVLKPSGAGRVLGFLGFFLPFWMVQLIPIKRNWDVQAAPNIIRGVCRQMIREKRETMEKGQSTGIDILSVALNSGGFSDDNLVDQLMTFLAAGHETTATAMVWALYTLCEHPEVASRLREEVTEHLPSIRDPASTVSASQMDALPYLNAVCSEILRLIPPVPFTMRASAKDNTILGQPIPKGTTVMIPAAAINVSPKMWGDDAEVFNPERWMASGCSNTGGAKSNYAFLTFIHGPRSCIGQGFSRAEFACLLAGWVMAYDFELQDKEKELKIVGGLTQRPKGGLQLLLRKLE
ncbi:MAG: hypothetical protein M1828_000869 [Chrysothrix sp. TS-e1954]|nr:MAG: hypothetical protein M1828_000869 [Chrysothrix sp. TS-e1954]